MKKKRHNSNLFLGGPDRRAEDKTKGKSRRKEEWVSPINEQLLSLLTKIGGKDSLGEKHMLPRLEKATGGFSVPRKSAKVNGKNRR